MKQTYVDKSSIRIVFAPCGMTDNCAETIAAGTTIVIRANDTIDARDTGHGVVSYERDEDRRRQRRRKSPDSKVIVRWRLVWQKSSAQSGKWRPAAADCMFSPNPF